MRPRKELLLVAAIAATIPVFAQQPARGDIVLTLMHHDPAEGFPVSNIRIHGSDGAFKRELITVDRRLSEPFYRDGIVYVGSRAPFQIERIDTAGNLLTPLSTQTVNVNYLFAWSRGRLPRDQRLGRDLSTGSGRNARS